MLTASAAIRFQWTPRLRSTLVIDSGPRLQTSDPLHRIVDVAHERIPAAAEAVVLRLDLVETASRRIGAEQSARFGRRHVAVVCGLDDGQWNRAESLDRRV